MCGRMMRTALMISLKNVWVDDGNSLNDKFIECVVDDENSFNKFIECVGG